MIRRLKALFADSPQQSVESDKRNVRLAAAALLVKRRARILPSQISR